MTDGLTFSLVGRRIGAYQILSPLGRGGMGDVYRAKDTKLGREVAIKVLPASFARDPERLHRFEREAQLLASLNDPHIGAIHGLEEFDGIRALVLELVEGETLAEKLASDSRVQASAGRSPEPAVRSLPVREALTIARQIAEALEAAHEKGIIHRDLKPANIKVRPDGNVKVLDFGLAKAFAEEGSGADLADSVLATAPGTRLGVILGTVAYMSPEQARGLRLDRRADIWAFGCVLFEMLAGKMAFPAETASDTIAAVLGREPDWSALPATTPPGIRHLLQRCLDKDTRRRLHDIADARIEIEDVLAAPTTTPGIAAAVPAAPTPITRWAPWFVAAVATAKAAGLAVREFRAAPAATPSRSVQVQRLTDMVGLEEAPALSPDGRSIAFVAVTGGKRQVWVRLLAGGSPLAVTKDDVDHYEPRWSPDSGILIYRTPGSQPGQVGAIWEIPALGGPTRRLVDAIGPADLSHDGKSLAFLRFHDGALELALAERDGSNVRMLTKVSPASYYTLKWSPDGRHIATVQDLGGANFNSNVRVFEVSSGQSRILAGDAFHQGLSWVADSSGLIVSSARGSTMSYPNTSNLWFLPIDGAASSQLTFGEASYEFPDLGGSNVVVSRVRSQADVWKFPVTGNPADNAQRGVRVTRQTGLVQTVTANPDDTEVAFLSDNGGHANVWVAKVADGEMRPVTREFDPLVAVAVPHWSPRGDWINFLTNRNEPSRDVKLWIARKDGSEAHDLGVTGAWACWSADGQWLYFSAQEQGVHHIRKVNVDGGQPVNVRDDNSVGCQSAPDGSLYFAKVLTQATGAWDYEVHRAKPESGPSELLGRVSGARVPSGGTNFQAILSPDGKWLAAPLLDGSTTNLWALSTTGAGWKKLTDFGSRNVMIARRIAWTKDSQHIFAAVSDVDSDIVMLAGLK